MSIFTGAFWRAAAERSLKSVAYSASALIIANGTGLLDTDWLSLVSVAGMSGLLSVLGSIASDAATGGTGPSLTSSETIATTVQTTAPEGAEVAIDVTMPKTSDDSGVPPESH